MLKRHLTQEQGCTDHDAAKTIAQLRVTFSQSPRPISITRMMIGKKRDFSVAHRIAIETIGKPAQEVSFERHCLLWRDTDVAQLVNDALQAPLAMGAMTGVGYDRVIEAGARKRRRRSTRIACMLHEGPPERRAQVLRGIDPRSMAADATAHGNLLDGPGGDKVVRSKV